MYSKREGEGDAAVAAESGAKGNWGQLKGQI